VLRNFEGMMVRYVENGDSVQDQIPKEYPRAALALGVQESLVPVGLPRELRGCVKVRARVPVPGNSARPQARDS